MFRKIGLLIVVLASVPALAAEPTTVEARKVVKRLAPPLGCDRITSTDGLPNGNVRAITQDRQGFIWFGTEDSLARYDGAHMRVYRPIEKDDSSILPGFTTALVPDASGKLWVSSDAGVSLYDPATDKFTRYTRATGLGADAVSAITRDHKDRMWFALAGGGVSLFDPTSKTFTPYASKPLDEAITAMAADPAGNLWLGTEGDGVIRWNPDTPTAFEVIDVQHLGTNATVSAIAVTSTGAVIIGTDGEGMRVFDPKTRKVTTWRSSAADSTTLSNDHVTAVMEDHAGALWIGTQAGVDRIERDGKLARFQHDPDDPTDLTQLSIPYVVSMFQDRGNEMWLGGLAGGVCKVDALRSKFGYYPTKAHASSFWEDVDGTLWVGSYGLYKYEGTAGRVTIYHTLGTPRGRDFGPLTAAMWISALMRDHNGTLWIAIQGKGLIAYDTQTESYKWYVADPANPSSLPVDTIFGLHEDAHGQIWLASWGAGLVRLDPKTETFTAFTTPDGGVTASSMTSNFLYTLYPDPVEQHVLWLGTAKGGVVKFDTETNAVSNFRHNDADPASLSSNDVPALYRDSGGILWVSSFGAGVNRLDLSTGKVERFSTANSALPNNTVFGILPGDDGKLWLSTNGHGLAELDPKTKTFAVYDVFDGAQSNEFFQGAFMRDKAGKLFFGGGAGFNAFFPKDIVRDTYAPPAALTGFKRFPEELKLDRPIWTLPEIRLGYSDSFEVQFAALSFAAPTRNRYAYMLEGFDDRFIETDRPYATYTKLDGGNYKLRVRTANRHGVWNESGLTLAIAVSPPWWRTWQAFAGGVLAVLVAGFLVFRWQRERLRRADREARLKLAEHDLELTGAVQSGFLPEKHEISQGRVHVCGSYRAATSSSGDWWWYQRMSGDRHVVLVGDVTGHGPGPAMVTAAVAAAFRVLIEHGLDDVKDCLDTLNNEVLRVAKGKYHMTMAALELDGSSGHWRLYNAGAPPMLVLGTGAAHKPVFCPGAPLGTDVGFELGRAEGDLAPAERLVLYTDGIPEISLPSGSVLGTRRFAETCKKSQQLPLAEAAVSILAQADAIRSGRPQDDDWTFAIVELT